MWHLKCFIGGFIVSLVLKRIQGKCRPVEINGSFVSVCATLCVCLWNLILWEVVMSAGFKWCLIFDATISGCIILLYKLSDSLWVSPHFVIWKDRMSSMALEYLWEWVQMILSIIITTYRVIVIKEKLTWTGLTSFVCWGVKHVRGLLHNTFINSLLISCFPDAPHSFIPPPFSVFYVLVQT